MIAVRNPQWETEVRALQPGWDSYQAKPITEAAIAEMWKLLVTRPWVVPRVNGGLQLEWTDISICIGPDGKVESE